MLRLHRIQPARLQSILFTAKMMSLRSTLRRTASTVKKTARLTDPSKVFEYLDGTTFRALDVGRIQAGTTNYAHRVVLAQPLENGKKKTAIVKYSGPYMVGEPTIAFSPERSTFEARALTHVPWQTFQYSTEHTVAACRKVDLPRLFFHDRDNHILVMEDCAPPNEGTERPAPSTNMIRQILHDPAASHADKSAFASVIGYMLGAFLAQLQAWGHQPQSHQIALKLIGGNTSARDIIIRETFTEFFENLDQFGYIIDATRKLQLEARINELAQAVRENAQSVCMGDFWSGNVLLSLNADNSPERISIIDWEFVNMAPTFVDVGNLIQELYQNNYFKASDSSYVTFLESFITAYRSLGVSCSFHDVLAFVGTRGLWSLSKGMSSPMSTVSKENVLPCVEQLLTLITGSRSDHVETLVEDPIELLIRFMKERADKVKEGKKAV